MSSSSGTRRVPILLLGGVSVAVTFGTVAIADHAVVPIVTPRERPIAVAWAQPGPEGEIAFVGTDGHVRLVNADGSGLRSPADDLPDADWPTWSQNGEYLAFSAGASAYPGPGENARCLYRLQVDSGARLSLACGYGDIHWTRWSPQDSRILFQATQGENEPFRFWVVDADGSDLRDVGPSGGMGLTWTSETTAAAVWSDSAATEAAAVYEFDVDDIGTSQRLSAARPLVRCSGSPVVDVSASPASGRLAYQHYECWDCICIACACPRMYVVLTQPTQEYKLLDTSMPRASFSHGAIRWSRDGRRLAFFRDKANRDIELVVLDVADGARRQWPLRDHDLFALDWSPSGGHLVVGFRPDGATPEVRVFDVADGQSRSIAEGTLPVWRPLRAPATPTATATREDTSTSVPSPAAGLVFLPILNNEYCPPVDTLADIVLVLDASTSMIEPASGGGDKLDAALSAAETFLRGDKLRLQAGGDRVGIVAFNAGAYEVHPLAHDRAALVRSLAGIRSLVAPTTRLDLGVTTAGVLLLSEPLDPAIPRHKAMLVLSDGKANPVPGEVAVQQASLLKAKGIRMWVVAIGPHPAKEVLRAMASGPEYFSLSLDVGELDGIFRRLAQSVPCPPYMYWGKR